jgi:hypothetical protein
MKIIISCLLIVLAFSGYMALTRDYRIISPYKMEMAPYVSPPTPPEAPASAEIKPEPQGEEIYVYEIENEDEDTDRKAKSDETYPTNVSNNSIEQEIADVFGSESSIALAVAKAESGLNPMAVNRNRNGSKDIGIFQINDRHGWSDEELLDWKNNIRIAKELRDRHGWSEWAVYNNGSYLNYL